MNRAFQRFSFPDFNFSLTPPQFLLHHRPRLRCDQILERIGRIVAANALVVPSLWRENPSAPATNRFKSCNSKLLAPCVLSASHLVVRQHRLDGRGMPSWQPQPLPTRKDAKEEECRIRREPGAAVVAVNISNNGKAKTATFTCAYTLRESRTEVLF